jgi:uroporphyrin-III C-methyltransferase / precorrin-2 dehydrogenase / sirohydrochlorin ferrochelatase
MLESLPRTVSSPSIRTLARLPIFLALESRRAVIAGGNAAAAWKAELLAAAGAHVEIYTLAPSPELLAVAEGPARGSMTIRCQSLRASDLAGAALLIGACETDSEAAALRALAHAAGVPINVIDKPEFCDFSFGAIVNRSPLVIGISTGGAAPVFAQAIRARLEALIPMGFARWAAAALLWRPRVTARGLAFRARRTFWEAFISKAILHHDRAPHAADLDDLLATTGQRETGSIVLVDARIADPELLTLRAVRELQSADVIVIDDAVSPVILDFARREAKKLTIGPTDHDGLPAAESLEALMIKLAKSGKRILRLIGTGINSVPGHALIATCRRSGVHIDVVPGVDRTGEEGAGLVLNASRSCRAG